MVNGLDRNQTTFGFQAIDRKTKVKSCGLWVGGLRSELRFAVLRSELRFAVLRFAVCGVCCGLRFFGFRYTILSCGLRFAVMSCGLRFAVCCFDRKPQLNRNLISVATANRNPRLRFSCGLRLGCGLRFSVQLRFAVNECKPQRLELRFAVGLRFACGLRSLRSNFWQTANRISGYAWFSISFLVTVSQ